MPNQFLIPDLTKKTMDAYVERGQRMGDFLTAVFSNDLVEAVGRADNSNMAALREIVQYMFCHTPAECWGSREAVKAWYKKKDEEKADDRSKNHVLHM